VSTGTDQTFETIPITALLDKAGAMRKEGYRLVQIGATRLPEHVELTYSFDRDLRLANLRLQVPAAEARVPSISSIYWCAFLYENEMHDLFNVQVEGMAVDFHGHLYETAVKFPFGSTKAPVAKPAPAPAAGQSASKTTVQPAASSNPAQPTSTLDVRL
jgi:ech hydrogenase subunit D